MRTRSVQRHIGESTRLWAGQGLNPKHPEALEASMCLPHRGTRSTGRTAGLKGRDPQRATIRRSARITRLFHPSARTARPAQDWNRIRGLWSDSSLGRITP